MDGGSAIAPLGWERQGAQCPECGFDWDEASYEVLVGQCVTNIAVFGGVLSRIDPAEAVDLFWVCQPLRVAHRRRPPLRN